MPEGEGQVRAQGSSPLSPFGWLEKEDSGGRGCKNSVPPSASRPRMLSGPEEMTQENLSKGQSPLPSSAHTRFQEGLGCNDRSPSTPLSRKSQVATRFHPHEPKTTTDVANVGENICVPRLNSPETWLLFPFFGICYTYKRKSNIQQNLQSLS